jgi:hypothetical protein
VTSNSKNESLAASDYLDNTDEAVTADAASDEVRLTQEQCVQAAELFTCDLVKKEVTHAHLR